MELLRLMALVVSLSCLSAFRLGHRRSGLMRRDALSMSAGKGFGQGQKGDADFPSIDAFAKDPNILIKDRNEMAKMPSEPAIDQFSKDRERKFDFNDLEFPTRFTLKVIGLDENNFLADVLNICCAVTKEDVSKIKYNVKNGRKGNYLSVSVSPLFDSGDDIYSLYSLLHQDSRVKFVL